MTRRRINIVLHWTVVLTVLAMMKGSAGIDAVRWAFVVSGALWVGIAALRGLLARPGPKLSPALRRGYRPAHVGIYALVGLAVATQVAALTGYGYDSHAWYALLALFGAGMWHALFQLWRHTALYDNALGTITPRRWQKYL